MGCCYICLPAACINSVSKLFSTLVNILTNILNCVCISTPRRIQTRYNTANLTHTVRYSRPRHNNSYSPPPYSPNQSIDSSNSTIPAQPVYAKPPPATPIYPHLIPKFVIDEITVPDNQHMLSQVHIDNIKYSHYPVDDKTVWTIHISDRPIPNYLAEETTCSHENIFTTTLKYNV